MKIMLPTFKFQIERWRFNDDFGVWVSTLGRFRNRDKADLPIMLNQKGYCCVKVDCTTCDYMKAHRLVMLTWHPTSEAENLTVDHKNHNKRDNSVNNLEWVTYEENLRRAEEDFIGIGKPKRVGEPIETNEYSNIKIEVRHPEMLQSSFKGKTIAGNNEAICALADELYALVDKNPQGFSQSAFIQLCRDMLNGRFPLGSKSYSAFVIKGEK